VFRVVENEIFNTLVFVRLWHEENAKKTLSFVVTLLLCIYIVSGNTALHDCAEAGSLEIMKLLFDYRAAVSKDAYGMDIQVYKG